MVVVWHGSSAVVTLGRSSFLKRIKRLLLAVGGLLVLGQAFVTDRSASRAQQQQQGSLPWPLSLAAINDDEDDDTKKSQVPTALASFEDDTIVDESIDSTRRSTLVNALAGSLLVSSAVAAAQLYLTQAYTPDDFVRLPRLEFIAALGDPETRSGQNAGEWGLWRQDPGPRGVWLSDYETQLVASHGQAPAGWQFAKDDWWLDEHGLITERPDFPLPAGRYLVTGARMMTTGLTISADGRWQLNEGTLGDATHLPCRSARYHPTTTKALPASAKRSDFPVLPGAIMPAVDGCDKQDYSVLLVVGKAK